MKPKFPIVPLISVGILWATIVYVLHIPILLAILIGGILGNIVFAMFLD